SPLLSPMIPSLTDLYSFAIPNRPIIPLSFRTAQSFPCHSEPAPFAGEEPAVSLAREMHPQTQKPLPTIPVGRGFLSPIRLYKYCQLYPKAKSTKIHQDSPLSQNGKPRCQTVLEGTPSY